VNEQVKSVQIGIGMAAHQIDYLGLKAFYLLFKFVTSPYQPAVTLGISQSLTP
jgi:hypothetical protein